MQANTCKASTSRRKSSGSRAALRLLSMSAIAIFCASAASASHGREIPHPAPPVRLAALGNPGTTQATPGTNFATVRANEPGVFGSVALGMSGIAAAADWRRVLAEDAGRFFREGCRGAAGPCGAGNWDRWTALREQAAGQPLRERIALVNRGVNGLLRYADDRTLYKRDDHWATLTQIVRAGAGDCEDFAIAKMWLLESLGVPLESMQLVALRDRARGLDHAVLAVHLPDEILILDNVHDRLLRDVEIAHYRPMFSFSMAQGFVHGFQRQPERMASMSR